ncbi:MAG: DUF4160 domain-containing protein [Polyangiaceae bacterium]|nr:DUF4160 domain-containing protein [Polyangiaceae bacterium]
MPRLATFNGIVICIYADDHNPPHVHAYYSDDSALIIITSGEVLEGYIPSKQLRQVQAWLDENRADVQAKWDDLNP